MSNEAAERLRGIPTQLYGCLERSCDHDYTEECIDDAETTLADERRATVERIRAALVIHNEWNCTNVLWPDEVNAILDAEDER
jgi:hypothetical protein